MYMIDSIIQNREQVLALVTKHGVNSLKLYGSALARKESSESDIDFLAIFDSSIDYDWQARFEVQEELEAYFNRRVSIVDARRIPDVFRPSIDIDPVDIMELSSDRHYQVTLKTSKLYYIMLGRMFKEYYLDDSKGTSEPVFILMAEKLRWWFSRLLRLSDNDLKEYDGFNYIEVLYLCNKIGSFTLRDYTDEDMERFKESLVEVRKYIQLRIR